MAQNTLSDLLTTLKTSVETAASSLCEPEQLQPPSNGISLLDTKNELFLSYLQNLVFLIVLKLRQTRLAIEDIPQDDEQRQSAAELRDDVVGKLVELRVYLEKGVKPLEGRLRYQIDKVVHAANDALLKSASDKLSINGQKGDKKAKANGAAAANGGSGSESDGSSEESEDEEDIDPLSYRPNPAAFAKPSGDRSSSGKADADKSDGIYRPPRITATTMPTAVSTADFDKKPRSAKAQRSATLDEFVASELSAAPMAEPSIGTTIREGGRRNAGTRERTEQRRREAYEETHFVRLPQESKAERRKKDKGRRARGAGWGGEDWRDIERGADRLIGALEKNRDREPGSKVRAALEKSRKRMRDEPGGSGGARMGEAFEKRRKAVEKRARRKQTR